MNSAARDPAIPSIIALAGNPNAGKTTFFNALTGSRQHVANYPGITVEYKEGRCRHDGQSLVIADLPGTYSLASASEEERVARRYLHDRHPEAVICVVDASNLERNLLLVIELMEFGLPVVVALNMSDLAEARGITIDHQRLAAALKAPVIPCVASKKQGCSEALTAALALDAGQSPDQLRYPDAVEEAIAQLVPQLDQDDPVYARWVALRMLEGDDELTADERYARHVERVAALRAHIEAALDDEVASVLTQARYERISTVCAPALTRRPTGKRTRSDRLDAILTHRVWGLPIFIALMAVVFQLTFTLGDPLVGWCEYLVSRLSAVVTNLFPLGSTSPLLGLLRDGIVGGVGGVLVFVPNIAMLFLAITVMEATGYMARAAFLMDRIMVRLGLHGKSFVPMLIGFGCTVPAIMGTRILDNRRDRLVTMLVLPLISCSARLPIYTLLAAAFFPRHAGVVLFAMYVIGMMLACLCAKILRSTLFKGDAPPFVLELPPYRLPTPRGLFHGTWERTWLFCKKAGTVILGISVLLWALAAWPRPDESALADLRNRQAANTTALVTRTRTLLPDADPTAVARAVARVVDLRQRTRRVGFGHPERLTAETKCLKEIETIAGEDADLATFFRTAFAFQEHAAAWEYHKWRKNWDAERWTEILHHEQRYSAPYLWWVKNLPGFQAWQAGAARHGAELEAMKRDLPQGQQAWAWTGDESPWFSYELEESHIQDQIRTRRLAHSLNGRLGHALEPLIAPMGFDWRIGTALVGAFAAKEVFVAQMGVIANVGEGEPGHRPLQEFLARNYTGLVGFCLMLFCLISAPCMATIAITRREANSWRWALFQLAGLTALAWLITTVVYQVGRWF
ncbi:MAG: ferrous iron transport protein B [Planctomycetota bacterium]